MEANDSSDLEHVMGCLASLRETLEKQVESTEDCKEAILGWKAPVALSDSESDFMNKVTAQLTELLADADRKNMAASERKDLLLQLSSKVNSVQDQIQSVKDDIASLHGTFRVVGESVRDALSQQSAETSAEVKILVTQLQAIEEKVQVMIAQVDEKTAINTRLLKTLIYNVHDVPTLMVLLPMPSKEGIKKYNPRNLLRDRAKLFFICSYTKELVPCGPKKNGYTVSVLKPWVKRAIPVLKVGLLILQIGLMASGVPIPLLGLAQEALGQVADKQAYLQFAEELLQQPLDSLDSSTDQLLGPSPAEKVSNLKSAVDIAQSTVSSIESMPSSNSLDHLQSSADTATRDIDGDDGGSMRSAYEAVGSFLKEVDPNLEHVGLVKKISRSGKVGWVIPSKAEEFAANDGVFPGKK